MENIIFQKKFYTKETLRDIPKAPGVYQMVDKDGLIMYVGKSKELYSRVRSYFKKSHEFEKLNRMVMFVETIEILVTETHLDAMLLEIQLIREKRPLYNKQFKKRDGYVYLCLANNSVFSITNDKGSLVSYGPFRNKEKVEDFKNFIEKISPITSFDNRISFNIIPKRLSNSELVETQLFLGELLKTQKQFPLFKRMLERRMIELSESMEYEKAKFIKDGLESFAYIKNALSGNGEVVYLCPVGQRYKAYLIRNLNIIEVEYLNGEEEVETFKSSVGYQEVIDDVDFQLVIYHELKKNPEYVKK